MAGEDHGTHCGLRIQRLQHGRQFADQRFVECVVHVGTIERHEADVVAHVDVEGFARKRGGCFLGGHGFRFLVATYMRNTPNLVGSTDLLSAAEMASPSTRRVSAGSITPSSHSRALAK